MALLLWKAWRKSLDDSPDPDAVLVWGAWPLAPLLWGRLGEIPSIIALRGSDVPGFNPRTSGTFWKCVAVPTWLRARLVTANSPSLARLARQNAPGISIEIIPNGVTLPLGAESRSMPVEFLEGCRPLRLLSASRLIPRKRVEWLIEALSVIPIDMRRLIEINIAGDGPERYRLETMVQELDLSAQVHFLSVVAPESMSGLYRQSDLFVHASMAEGLSNALLEAMAAGLPCLCAEPTGFPDLDGAVCAFENAGILARRIIEMMASPDVYVSFSQASLEAASHYSWESTAARYAGLLQTLIQRS